MPDKEAACPNAEKKQIDHCHWRGGYQNPQGPGTARTETSRQNKILPAGKQAFFRATPRPLPPGSFFIAPRPSAPCPAGPLPTQARGAAGRQGAAPSFQARLSSPRRRRKAVFFQRQDAQGKGGVAAGGSLRPEPRQAPRGRGGNAQRWCPGARLPPRARPARSHCAQRG